MWDAFCEAHDRIHGGADARMACDHVRRFREDVALMRDLGVDAYRFSISWPRVLPDGRGPVHQEGLDFYRALCDELLAAGIAPYACLFHWDFPEALFRDGGWQNSDSPKWFSEYAAVAAESLADRVASWLTFNEPSCFLGDGHLTGVHAPGLKLPPAQFLAVLRNALLAHGDAVRAIRASTQAPVGIAVCTMGAIPASAADVEAAARFSFELGPWTARPFWHAGLYLDPIVKGVWPAGVEAAFGAAIDVSDEDLRRMSPPLDWLGLNYYADPIVRQGDGGPTIVPFAPDQPRSAFGWPIAPEGLEWALRLHGARYGLPMLVTENGMARFDEIDSAGRVRDDERIAFIEQHLEVLDRAREAGADVRGYFHWTLLDNFEWAEGYRVRFGLVHVDFVTQRRTPKDSFHAFARTVRSRR